MADNKKAFVMMAYDKEYNRIYSIVIKPALERLGYECIRQDQAGAGGYIMQNVIRNIAEAEIVIADLSAWKFNVAYELGLRHALSRNGTILMCTADQKENAQFDIQHLDVLYYDPDWMNNFGEEAIISELTKRIGVIESKGNALVDSPVHSIFTELPDNVTRMTGDSASALADKVARLEVENAALKERIEQAGLDEKAQEKDTADISAQIKQAIQDRIYYSTEATSRLSALSQEGKIEEFGDFLAKVIERGDLDETDCHNVYVYCNRFKAPMLTKIFLEYATKKYPENDELTVWLAQLLSQNSQTRESGLRMANEMIGLSRRNGRYELATKSISTSVLGGFFNVYLNLKRYEELVKVCQVLLDKYEKKPLRSLTIKNMVSAYISLEDYENAEKTLIQLMEYDPRNDNNQFTAYRLFMKQEKFEKAYLAMENAIRVYPNYENYYYNIASIILSENIARTSEEEPPHTIDGDQAMGCAIPFVLACLKLPRADKNRAIQFFRQNGCEEALDLWQKGELFNAYDMDMVYYCSRKELDPLFD